MAHDVFISYSSKDKLVADAVCATLEANKIRCWITPRDILPGQDWAESIEGAITRCKLLVLIFSSYSNNSKQVAREVSLAFNSDAIVIPFRIEDIEPKGAMKYYLLNTHWQDALTPPMENNIKKLVEIVSVFIGRKIAKIKEEIKISPDKSKEAKEQKLDEYEIPEHAPAAVPTGQVKKPVDLEIKKGFIKKQNKKKLSIILGVVGVVIIAAVVALLIKFPINKTKQLAETTTVEITTTETSAAETTAIETTAAKTTETSAAAETTLLQPESGQGALYKIAFVSNRDDEIDEIYIMDSDGSNQKNLTNNGSYDDWPRFSPDGLKIAFVTDRDGNPEIYIMDSDGSNLKNLTNNEYFCDREPCFSPDGSKIAFVSYYGINWEIYIMGSDGTNIKNLTNNRSHDVLPCFSPDGLKIIFVTDRNVNYETPLEFEDIIFNPINLGDIYIMDSDGSNQQRLTNNGSEDSSPCFSPDGSKIAFVSVRDGNAEIYIMDSDGTNIKNLTNNESHDFSPCFSPDGSKIAFGSYRDGNNEIYIMDSDGTNQKRLTNNESDDFSPCFSPDY